MYIERFSFVFLCLILFYLYRLRIPRKKEFLPRTHASFQVLSSSQKQLLTAKITKQIGEGAEAERVVFLHAQPSLFASSFPPSLLPRKQLGDEAALQRCALWRGDCGFTQLVNQSRTRAYSSVSAGVVCERASARPAQNPRGDQRATQPTPR